jgi:hypothetical protein
MTARIACRVPTGDANVNVLGGTQYWRSTAPITRFCERLVGTIRRECLDFLIPLNESHLRSLLKAWVTHYNQGRPQASLGPGIPDPPDRVLTNAINRRIPTRHRVVAMPILGGLHHEYRLKANAA